MEVDHRLRGHQALGHHQRVTLLLQQLIQTGLGAVFHRVAVADQQVILRQAAVHHRLLIGSDPLLGRGQPGQAADHADPLVALARQTADAAVDRLEIGHAHRREPLCIKGPVHQHHRKSGGDQGLEPAEVLHGAGDEQTVHQSRGKQADIGLLPLWVLLCIGNDQMVSVGREIILHGFDHCCEKLIGNIRNDKSNGFFLSGPEASGRGVRRVAQLRDSPVDLLLGLAGDVAGRVDGVGNRGGGNTCQPCHIADGHLHDRSPLYAIFLRLRNHLHFTVYAPASYNVKSFLAPFFYFFAFSSNSNQILAILPNMLSECYAKC